MAAAAVHRPARARCSAISRTCGRELTRLARKAAVDTRSAVRRPRPPQETPVVACPQASSGGEPVVADPVSVEAQLVGKLRHVGAQAGQDELGGGVVGGEEGEAGGPGLLHDRFDLVVNRLCAAEGGAQGERGAPWVEDVAGGAHVVGAPAVVE
eukprot:5215650-Pyramimonas_sp.AAC.1